MVCQRDKPGILGEKQRLACLSNPRLLTYHVLHGTAVAYWLKHNLWKTEAEERGREEGA